MQEWQNYVDEQTANKYLSLSKPFLPITKACPCSQQITFSEDPAIEYNSRAQVFDRITDMLEEMLVPTAERSINAFAFGVLQQFEVCKNKSLGKGISIDFKSIHANLMKDIKLVIKLSPSVPHTAKPSPVLEISSLLGRLETDADRWKDLAFQNIQLNPIKIW